MVLVVTKQPRTSLLLRKVSANRSITGNECIGILFLYLLIQDSALQLQLTRCVITVEGSHLLPMFLIACWMTGKDTGTMVGTILSFTLEEDVHLQEGKRIICHKLKPSVHSLNKTPCGGV